MDHGRKYVHSFSITDIRSYQRLLLHLGLVGFEVFFRLFYLLFGLVHSLIHHCIRILLYHVSHCTLHHLYILDAFISFSHLLMANLKICSRLSLHPSICFFCCTCLLAPSHRLASTCQHSSELWNHFDRSYKELLFMHVFHIATIHH